MSRGKSTRGRPAGRLAGPGRACRDFSIAPAREVRGPGPLAGARRAPRGRPAAARSRPWGGCRHRAPTVQDVGMSTAGTSPPGQSAPPFSPGSEQYVNGLPPGFVFPGTENLDPAEIFSGPGYTAPRPRTDSRASAALLGGLLSFIPLIGVAAIFLGISALRRLRHSYDSGEGLAWLGLILGGVSVILWPCLLLILFVG